MFRSKWNGIWNNHEGKYAHSCAMIKEVVSDIPNPFRIVIKKNKHHRKGDNRPEFLFAFADADLESCSKYLSSKDITYLGIDEDGEEHESYDENEWIKKDDAIRIAIDALYDLRHGSSIDDVSYRLERDIMGWTEYE